MVIGDEIFAENGFVYNVDRVVIASKNAYQLLQADYPDKSYSQFLDIINQFPKFDYNDQETFDQIGADQGLEVDSLFDLTFPELTFHLTKEKTKAPPGASGLPGNVTIRYQHGLLAPTNTALEKLNAKYLPGGFFWDGIENAPINIQRIVANSHLAQNAVYKTDIEKGFYNGEQDIVTIEENSIVQKDYASNATFLGLDDPIEPRAFSSVTGPIYLRKGYAKVMRGIEASGLLPALKRKREVGEGYMLFVEADANSSADSSYLYNASTESFFAFQVSGSTAQSYSITKNDLRTLLLNHIAVRKPTGIPRKEFIPNLAGNYIIFNNETGEVKGTGKTTAGYLGTNLSTVIPKQIDINADNGSTWEIDDWFSFVSSKMYNIIQLRFPEFQALIIKAGLADTKLAKYRFTSESENYTVFAPTAAALTAVQADTLATEDLQKFILAHFIRKDLIFTDDHAVEGYYETLCPDEISSSINIVNKKIYIDPGLNEIDFPAKSGGSFTTLVESDSTNVLAGQLLSQGQVTFPVMINNAVIHKLDKALLIEELDVTR
ncbi:MAG: fasciclin domain-containing protein [Bacteroidales bacterium]|jgi:uncharacterized surface protein with fasciclin (FAS1) repeats|nr:fasciclin domain-containing protein [Bacteroidales bacterium]